MIGALEHGQGTSSSVARQPRARRAGYQRAGRACRPSRGNAIAGVAAARRAARP
jgi:hypothetical protein